MNKTKWLIWCSAMAAASAWFNWLASSGSCFTATMGTSWSGGSISISTIGSLEPSSVVSSLGGSTGSLGSSEVDSTLALLGGGYSGGLGPLGTGSSGWLSSFLVWNQSGWGPHQLAHWPEFQRSQSSGVQSDMLDVWI